MSWRRLGVLVRHLPRTSRLIAAERPDLAWDADTHLLANIVDLLAGANWQRGTDPKHPGPKPKPIPRPGLVLDDDEGDHLGTAIPLDQLERRLHPYRFDDDGNRREVTDDAS